MTQKPKDSPLSKLTPRQFEAVLDSLVMDGRAIRRRGADGEWRYWPASEAPPIPTAVAHQKPFPALELVHTAGDQGGRHASTGPSQPESRGDCHERLRIRSPPPQRRHPLVHSRISSS